MKLWPYYVGWGLFELVLRTQYDNWFAWSVNASWTLCWFLLFIHSLKDKTAWFPTRAVVMVLAWEVTLNIRYWTDVPGAVSYHNVHANLWPFLTMLNLYTSWKFVPEKLAWPFSVRRLKFKVAGEYLLALSLILFSSYGLGSSHTNNWQLDAFLIPVLSVFFLVDLIRRKSVLPPKIPHLLRIFGEVIWMIFLWNLTRTNGPATIKIAVVITLLVDALYLVILSFPGMIRGR
ncbi:MAG: hypothetical protein V4598_12915 [Bdellovibrionota bacterium]